MTELEKVLQSFAEQIASGYTCVDKMNKYAKDIDDNYPDWYNGKKYGVGTKDWCTIFFDWNFINALGEDRAQKVLNRPKKSCGAGVRWSRAYLKDIGRVGDEPKVGCAVYFGELPYPRHIGFVYKVTDTMIYTYEGNCYVSSNVTGVKARSYKRTNSDILDYGYPVYSDEPEPDPKELDGFKVGNNYEVICTDPLMIRKGPGKSFAKIGELKTGDRITCTGLRHDEDINTWIQFDRGWCCGIYQGTHYLADPSPVKDGWIKKDGKWYYFRSGKMVTSDWIKYKGDLYYMGADGAMVTGWQTINGNEYYFYEEGHMANSEWIDGRCIDHNGRVDQSVTGKWKHNDKGWWFEDSAGWYPKNRSVIINRIEYEFDKDGYLIEK